jgi:hypothetical protein
MMKWFALPSLWVVLCMLIASDAFGDVPRGRSLCEINPGECAWQGSIAPAPAAPQTPSPAASSRVLKSAVSRSQGGSGGNLPAYLSGPHFVPESPDGVVIAVEKPTGALLPGLRPGDLLQALLEQSVKASPGVPTPVRARVTLGRFKNVVLLGAAILDADLKRILLTFDRLRLPRNDAVYSVKATGLAPSGQVGLEGEHHTAQGLYLAGELAAATVGGFADATVSRSQTSTGAYQTEPSLANAGKLGMVQALSKTADRFAERTRNAPEYTEIEAEREIQILIQETPAEVGTP